MNMVPIAKQNRLKVLAASRQPSDFFQMVTRIRAPHTGAHVLPDLAVEASIRFGSKFFRDALLQALPHAVKALRTRFPNRPLGGFASDFCQVSHSI